MGNHRPYILVLYIYTIYTIYTYFPQHHCPGTIIIHPKKTRRAPYDFFCKRGRGPPSICIINEGLQPQLRVPDATPATPAPAEVEEVKERVAEVGGANELGGKVL